MLTCKEDKSPKRAVSIVLTDLKAQNVVTDTTEAIDDSSLDVLTTS